VGSGGQRWGERHKQRKGVERDAVADLQPSGGALNKSQTTSIATSYSVLGEKKKMKNKRTQEGKRKLARHKNKAGT